MATTTDLTTLKINYLTQSQFDTALASNQINADELYFTPESNEVTITLNGNSITAPSFYAPTSSGTSGQYLKSNGNGQAPTWDSITLPSNIITGQGTDGHLAQWSGTNALTAGPKVTVSTNAPSGGSNGDIWFTYNA